MNTIGKRLTYLIESKGLNKSEFCEEYGFAYSSFNPITLDKRPLGINLIKDLMKAFPNLNLNWLLFGTGEVNYNKNDSLIAKHLINEPGDDYIIDPVEKTFLAYLDKQSIRKKVLEIVNDEKK